MIDISEELRRTQALLKIEQEEDLNQYKLKVPAALFRNVKKTACAGTPLLLPKPKLVLAAK